MTPTRTLTPHEANPVRQTLRQLVNGLYDLQKLRIATGNRVIANLKARLGSIPSEKEEKLSKEAKEVLNILRTAEKLTADGAAKLVPPPSFDPDHDDPEDDTEDEDKAGSTPEERKLLKKSKSIAKTLFTMLNKEYALLTDKRKRIPSKDEFTAMLLDKTSPLQGMLLIDSFSEFALATQYVELKKQEESGLRRLEGILEEFPVYTEFLKDIKGCGNLMSAVIVSYLDPYKAPYVSSFWAFCGLDVVQGSKDAKGKWVAQGTSYAGATWSEGRGRYEYHLVDRQYTDAAGREKTRRGTRYDPFVKTKLLGVLAGCLIKAKNEQYRKIYDDYKHRLENHERYGTQNDKKVDEERNERFKQLTPGWDKSKNPKFMITSPGRRNRMALRYMIKLLLRDLYVKWRALENLEVKPSYQEAKLGHAHGSAR